MGTPQEEPPWWEVHVVRDAFGYSNLVLVVLEEVDGVEGGRGENVLSQVVASDP